MAKQKSCQGQFSSFPYPSQLSKSNNLLFNFKIIMVLVKSTNFSFVHVSSSKRNIQNHHQHKPQGKRDRADIGVDPL